jgi:hypothetical protein
MPIALSAEKVSCERWQKTSWFCSANLGSAQQI